MMNNKKIILVVAGDYQEYRYWCEDQWNKEPFDVGEFNLNYQPVEYLYVSSPEHIRGLKNVIGIEKIGTWANRDDIDWDYINVLLNR